MEIAFAGLSILTLGSAIAAMRLRNLVHCALFLAVTLSGLAGFYLLLNAEFIAFAQILVYVGAVAILIFFAILLTRSGEPAAHERRFSVTAFQGLAVTVLAAGSLVFCILGTPGVQKQRPMITKPTVKAIGDQLMTNQVLPLEAIGLLLTAATIGAAMIALPEHEKAPGVDEKEGDAP